MQIDGRGLTRFKHSSDHGAGCLCSACGKEIGEKEVPILMWPPDGSYEIRLHLECFKERARPVMEELPKLA